MNIIDQAYEKAIGVIKACSKSTGLYASGLPGGYEATWARDSMITSLGATTVGREYKSVIAKSIALLATNQGEMGQIPNCVGSYNNDRQSDVTFNSVDSPLWFIIGNYVYADAFLDNSLLKKIPRPYLPRLFLAPRPGPGQPRFAGPAADERLGRRVPA